LLKDASIKIEKTFVSFCLDDQIIPTLSYMLLFRRFSIITLLMFCFKTEGVFAQLGGAVSLAGKGILAIAGGSRQEKQEKIIEQSSSREKISGTNVTVLRVKEADIKSKAKSHIIALQNRLDQYATQYKNNQPIEVPKNDDDLIAIQNKDENWPVENYINELRAYRRYVFQQKQKNPNPPSNNLPTGTGDNAKKDTSSVHTKG
jgi:hypothetical protein